MTSYEKRICVENVMKELMREVVGNNTGMITTIFPFPINGGHESIYKMVAKMAMPWIEGNPHKELSNKECEIQNIVQLYDGTIVSQGDNCTCKVWNPMDFSFKKALDYHIKKNTTSYGKINHIGNTIDKNLIIYRYYNQNGMNGIYNMYIQKKKEIPILDDDIEDEDEDDDMYMIYQLIELKNGDLIISSNKGIKLFKFNDDEYKLDKYFDIPYKNKRITVLPIKNEYILFGLDNGNIMVEHNDIYHEIKCCDGFINKMILLNNGNLLTCSGRDVKIWKISYLDNVKLNALYEFKNECYINCIVELLDGTIITGDDSYIKFWINKTCINSISFKKDSINCLYVLYDGKLIYGTENGVLCVLK